jgi:hypothetical protein
MSPLTRNQTIWAAIIGAVAVIVAALITVFGPAIIHRLFTPDNKAAHINGVVSDTFNKAPMSGVLVKLETDAGTQLTQDTTDGDGNFNLALNGYEGTVRVIVALGGYEPYEKKLPAQETRNDINLVRQPIVFGMPDGIPLQKALDTLAGDLNITAVFASACGKGARAAALNGGQMEGDPRAIEDMLKDLLTRVKDNNRRYGVTIIEVGKRYEIRCS